ncbi:stalk domain-containing protein [Geosporobacter ferrireducens]|uniref:Big-1 domain-containing protein n=1 Tax=Geosporobacter ferrireducens TaxID=1424294 RepID=A0A1D8GM30_9FIRM|nr:stalk domain-containing protein [Geosporobacter ferrireducens]AOT71978.1 hypothetical protein Gferi_22010 [Geosporobacter ferrireducens]
MRKRGFNKITVWLMVVCMLAGVLMTGMPITAEAEGDTGDGRQEGGTTVTETVYGEEDLNDPQPTVFSLLESMFTVSEGDVYVYNGWTDDMDEVITFPDGTVIDGHQSGAYTTIKDGVAGVQSGRTVYIADGDGPYTGTNNRDITIDKNLTIVGKSQEGTIIDAQQSSRIFTIEYGRNVIIGNLTFMNGQGQKIYYYDDDSYAGGAILNGGTLTVYDSAFAGNTAENWGGAIYNDEGTLTVDGSTFTGNSSGFLGGAIQNDFGILTVHGSSFTNNDAEYGGAIYENSHESILTVQDSTFTGNAAEVEGGAIYSGNSALVNNCSFVGNSAEYAGAIKNAYYSTLTVHSSTFENNTAGYGGGAIYNDYNLTVHDSIFTGNTAATVGGGAIYNGGFGDPDTINNSTFTNNRATNAGYGGGAIWNYGDVDLIIDNCNFASNSANRDGGAIYNYGGPITVNNSDFTDNRATRNGGGIYNDDTLIVDGGTFTNNSATTSGGAIYNAADSTVDDSTFTGNSATASGGAVYSTGNSSRLTVRSCSFTSNRTANTGTNRNGGAIYSTGSSNRLTVTSSNFITNSANTNGGAVYINSGNAEIYFNRIIGNTPNNNQIRRQGGTVNINNNWWGDNGGATGKISGTVVTPTTWLLLTVKADPTTIDINETSTVTADLLHDQNGSYHAPANGHVPDGIPITFNITNSEAPGNIDPLSGIMVNGQATSDFTASNPDIANITATVDDQQFSTEITINKTPTGLTVDDATGDNGQTIPITALLTDCNDQALTGKSITFSVGGTDIGAAITDAGGIAAISYTITESEGSYPITAQFAGDTGYIDSIGTGTLTVNAAAVTLESIDVTAPPDKTIYYVGEAFDLTGLVVTGTYSDGSSAVLNIIMDDISGFDSSRAVAGQEIIVTYEGKTAIFTVDIVTVLQPAINSVTLSPATHVAGKAQTVQVNVVTRDVADDTPVTASLVDSQGRELNPAISNSGTTNGNAVSFSINIGGSVSSGDYQVKVEVNGVTEAYLTPYSITVAEVPLAISATDPVGNATGIAIGKTVTVVFNKNIQAGPQYENISITYGQGSEVSVNKSISGSTLILQASLAYSTVYTVIIPDGAIEGTDSSRLASTYEFSFTTRTQSNGGDGGGRGSVSAPKTSIITDVMETAGDKSMDKALIDKGKAMISMAGSVNNFTEISAAVINRLAEHKQSFFVENTGVQLEFVHGFLNGEQLTGTSGKTVVELGVREVSEEEKEGILARTAEGQRTGLFEIGGQIFDLTALIKNGEDTTRIEKFGQPVAVTIDLSHLGHLSPEQISQLTGTRLEKDKYGNLVPVSLGGKYDPAIRTFTFYTDKFSLYTVMQAKETKQLLNIQLTIGSSTATVNEKAVSIDVPPALISGRTLVPVRFIAESMGAKVDWQGETQTVKITLEGNEISLVIGEAKPEAGLEVPAIIINGRTLVPLRYVSEMLGAHVNWFPSTKTVEIVK